MLNPRFWEWSRKTVQSAYDKGVIHSTNLWKSKVPYNSKETTWMNWPMQAAGAEIMRLTVIYLDRQNVQLLAPIHDGFLISCRKNELEKLKQAIDYACSLACEQVLQNFKLKWTTTVFENGKYFDEDGEPLWNLLQSFFDEKSI